VSIVDLNNPGVVKSVSPETITPHTSYVTDALGDHQSKESPLKMQTRVITCFPARSPAGNGYAIGSVEGRVAIQYASQPDLRIMISTTHLLPEPQVCRRQGQQSEFLFQVSPRRARHDQPNEPYHRDGSLFRQRYQLQQITWNV
jgi:hypothetical protein